MNEEDRNYMIKAKLIDKNKAVLIKSEGIDTDKFSPDACRDRIRDESSGKFIFLMISRLLWDKGVKEYVEAGKLLKEKYDNIELWLLGPIDDGNPSSISKDQIYTWEKKGLINYLGYTNDVRPYIYKADCVVLPSYYREGFPRVILEAMAMEKPVITTDVPGCRDAVIDNVNGFLVKPRDILSLSRAMERIMKLSQEERKAMGKKGRNIVLKEFDEKIIIDKYLEVIKEVFEECR